MTIEQYELMKRLKKVRTSQHLTLDELANISNVSKSEISFIETGRTMPKLDTIQKLAKALNTTSKYLLKGE